MKKFLLSTSAIVGVGLIAAPASAAEPIKLGFGGYYEEYIGFVDAESDGTGATGRDIASFNLLNDAEIYFQGKTKLDNGITISVRVEFEAMENQTTVDESYVTIASDTMGMIRLGGDDAAMGGAYVGPDRGIGGDYDNWIAEVNATTNDNAYDTGNAGDDPKVTYWSPRIGGFQLAASYVPSTGSQGNTSPSAVNTDTANHSAYSVSLTWKEKVGEVGVNSQIAMYKEGQTAAGARAGQTNANVGIRLAYQGWDLGYAYGRFIEKRRNIAEGTNVTDDGRTHGVGLSYKSGAWKLGVWHLNHQNEGLWSNSNQDETKAYTLAGQYQLSDGVLLQGMVFNVDYDEEASVDANEQSGGWGVVAGMKLTF
jgi:hypothetical protein